MVDVRRWSCVVLGLLGSIPTPYAAPITPIQNVQQTSQALVRGRVVDSSGAAIVGAQVTVTSDRPGAPASAVTNQKGEFEIPMVPGGSTVRVSANGFREASVA